MNKQEDHVNQEKGRNKGYVDSVSWYKRSSSMMAGVDSEMGCAHPTNAEKKRRTWVFWGLFLLRRSTIGSINKNYLNLIHKISLNGVILKETSLHSVKERGEKDKNAPHFFFVVWFCEAKASEKGFEYCCF